MYLLAYVTIVVVVIGAAIAHFVLLILKTDQDAGFSYHVVAAPAFVAYALGVLFFGALAWLGFSTRRGLAYGFGFLAMATLALGSLWTQILLARKFDLTESVSYLNALLPVIVAFLVSGVLLLAAVFSSRSQKTKPRGARNRRSRK